MYGRRWRPYVPVAARRVRAAREAKRLAGKGVAVEPVVIEGRRITNTFWGDAWCANLEHYADFANRLPRGRTYVRNGSVIHLTATPGGIRALVSGSEIYSVEVSIRALPADRWKAIRGDCAGSVASVVELLTGTLSKGVMERVSRPGTGLFPAPAELTLRCSCPDWADLCKHVAAVLYGIGARLDTDPALLFRLRGTDPAELVADAAEGLARVRPPAGDRAAFDAASIADVFGIEVDGGTPPVRRGRTAGARSRPAGSDPVRGAGAEPAGAGSGRRPAAPRPKGGGPARSASPPASDLPPSPPPETSPPGAPAARPAKRGRAAASPGRATGPSRRPARSPRTPKR